MNQQFISKIDARNASEMNKIGLVHRTLDAVNELLDTKTKVKICFTDGINTVNPNEAKYAEIYVINE